jgi:single-strand DNA-binding protein
VKKGSRLHIEGKLETRTFEKDGSKRYVAEVVLHPYSGEIVLLDAKDAPPDALEAAE